MTTYETGYFVRAATEDGWDSVDIAQLTRDQQESFVENASPESHRQWLLVTLEEMNILAQQNAQLLAALEAVEWYYVYDDPIDGHPVMKCPSCERGLGLGHKEYCQTKLALAPKEMGEPDNG